MFRGIRTRLISCLMVVGLLAGGMAAITPTAFAASGRGGPNSPIPYVYECQYWTWQEVATDTKIPPWPGGSGYHLSVTLYRQWDSRFNVYCGSMYAWASLLVGSTSIPSLLYAELAFNGGWTNGKEITVNTGSYGTSQTSATAVQEGTTAYAEGWINAVGCGSPCGGWWHWTVSGIA